MICIFNNSHFWTQSLIHRPQFQTNHPSSNYNHFFGNFFQSQSPSRSDDLLLIKFEALKRSRFTSSGNNDIFALYNFFFSIIGYFYSIFVKNLSKSLHIFCSIFFKQKFNSPSQCLYHFVLFFLNRPKLEFRLWTRKTPLFQIVQIVIFVTNIQ